MKKCREGLDETILEPELPIVDAHHHLFDRPALRYMLEDYLEDATAGHRIVASIYSETLSFVRPNGPEHLRPLGEVEFANGVGAMAASGRYGDIKVCHGMIGHADMRQGDKIADLLDQSMALAPTRFCGVRHITMEHWSEEPYKFMSIRPEPGLMSHPNFHKAFLHVAERKLVFDAAVFSHQLPEVCALADAFPDTSITLNHLGVAMGLGISAAEKAELYIDWKKQLAQVAERHNITCKVGGLGMPLWGFGFEEWDNPTTYLDLADAWRPYVEVGIELFGPDRCMMESNFPPDGRSGGFVPTWNALKHIARAASDDEKAAMFHKTALSVHGLVLPELLE
ncbi:amidohydrolase [Sulfitobacter sp. EhC04]|uniref:amidohydrolase family protein n=1 Tax=Sulfitobacter sp. EhC04 TaxID=1849168 RepID=UPI0007F3A1A8|nr:amidohydrolase family protein [Sulfitobacter sp. EhC04]OAN75960.1 amidohydrolase [Sulfitobacter sp. EhC04]